MAEKLPSNPPISDSDRPTNRPPKPEKREGKLQPEMVSMGKVFGMNLSDDAHLEHLDADEETGVFLVADGMGGTPGGEIASEAVVETMKKYLPRFEDIRRRRDEDDEDATLEAEATLMRKALRESNARVVLKREEYPAMFRQMATTATAARLTKDKEGNYFAIIGHVGDSRACLLHPDGRFETLTMDDHISLSLTKRMHGEETAIHAQDILDNLTNITELLEYQALLAEGKPLPDGASISADDVRFLEKNMDKKDIKYFFGRSSELFESIGNMPDVKTKIIPVPRGAKLALYTDAVDGLRRTEIEAILKGEYDKLEDPEVRKAAEAWGSNTAQALAFAARERGEQHNAPKPHPKSKGMDDTTVVIIPVPLR